MPSREALRTNRICLILNWHCRHTHLRGRAGGLGACGAGFGPRRPRRREGESGRPLRRKCGGLMIRRFVIGRRGSENDRGHESDGLHGRPNAHTSLPARNSLSSVPSSNRTSHGSPPNDWVAATSWRRPAASAAQQPADEPSSSSVRVDCIEGIRTDPRRGRGGCRRVGPRRTRPRPRARPRRTSPRRGTRQNGRPAASVVAAAGARTSGGVPAQRGRGSRLRGFRRRPRGRRCRCHGRHDHRHCPRPPPRAWQG